MLVKKLTFFSRDPHPYFSTLEITFFGKKNIEIIETFYFLRIYTPEKNVIFAPCAIKISLSVF